MNMYTERLSREIDAISIEDENFAEELFQVADLFRPFSEAMDEFLAAHGYQDDVSDIESKVSFLREKFRSAGITPPRDMRKWFTEGKFISRETAYQICFAFRLNVEETERFFQRVYARDRGFDCHMMKEAVYYFCIRNGYSYPDAEEMPALIKAERFFLE